MSRISFDKYQAGHLYELSLEHMCLHSESCFLCGTLKKRLEKFLGIKEVRYVKKLLKKNGYCNKLLNNQKE